MNGVERMSVARLCLNWVGDCRRPPGRELGVAQSAAVGYSMSGVGG
jgi:hypothetical protein